MNPRVRKAVREFAKRIKSELGEDVELMLLYGSALTDRYDEEKSDIDVMIVSPWRETYDKILDIQTEVGVEYGVAFSVLFESPSEVRDTLKAGSPFMKNVMKSGEVLHGNHKRRTKASA